MAKRLIPFRLTPASWGLVGNAYREAEAYYNLEGEALDRRLLEIRLNNDPDGFHKWKLESIDIDQRYGKLSAYDAAIRRVEITHAPGVEHDLEVLDIDHRHGKITDVEYQKSHAKLKNEPWVCIVNSGFDPSQGVEGVFFEFDWNEQWIEFLRSHGYTGHTDEQVIDEWFADVCRSQQVHTDTVVPFSISRTE